MICGCGWRSESLLRLGYEEEALLPLFDFMFAAIQEASDTQVAVVKPCLQDNRCLKPAIVELPCLHSPSDALHKIRIRPDLLTLHR